MRRITLGLLSLSVMLLIMAPALRALTLEDFPDPRQYEVGTRDWLRAVESLRYRPFFADSLTESCPHSYDVLHYDITLLIDITLETIDGNTRIQSMSAEAGLAAIDLDFTVLTVDSVFGPGGPLAFVHNDPVLTVTLDQAYAEGDTFEVQVYYHGTPGNEGPSGFGGFYFGGVPIHAYQMGVGLDADPPSMGKYWFPCWDWPCDKATAEYHITLPGTAKKVICNGVRTGVTIDSTASTITYDYEMNYQIAPHCMTVNAGRFTEIADSTYPWMSHWVFPAQYEDALIHFENCPVMMEGYIERYGPYPFDRFGFVMEAKGDMEHQTCVTHTTGVMGPNHNYDWLLAHEMGHMWWGDCISVGDWRDVWLSEGFATFSEGIFHEHAYGVTGYRDYIRDNIMGPVLSSGENFPIYDPVYLWGTTTYEKGACVLHMLRHVVGDSLFFEGMAAYRAAYEYGYAVTPQFQEVMETVSGLDLDYFFAEWIYDRGWPVYEHSWLADSLAGGYDLNLVVEQVQTNGPVFAMPVDFRITTTAGDTTVVLWVDEASESFDLLINDEPVAVDLDPDNWILNEGGEVPYAGVTPVSDGPRLMLEQNVPNPFRPSTSIRYVLPRAQHARIDVYDATGRRVVCLMDEEVPEGNGSLIWNGTDDAGRRVAPGTYFCRLVTADGTRVTRMVHLR
jgi:aminopeptidase N